MSIDFFYINLWKVAVNIGKFALVWVQRF